MAQQLIEQKLESLRRCLSRIQSRLPETADQLASDLDAQDIVALNLTRSIQICVDLASHWVSQHPELPSPQTMGESFELLSKIDVISPELAANLRRSVGFRNIMVHAYEEVDWNIVFAICTRHIHEFKDFARNIAIAAELD